MFQVSKMRRNRPRKLRWVPFPAKRVVCSKPRGGKKKSKNLNAVKRSRLRTDFGNIKVIDDSEVLSPSVVELKAILMWVQGQMEEKKTLIIDNCFEGFGCKGK